MALGVKNPSANAGDVRDEGSIARERRSPGVGKSNPLQYSCLEKLHGQKTLVGYSPWGCKESDMAKHQAAAAAAAAGNVREITILTNHETAEPFTILVF